MKNVLLIVNPRSGRAEAKKSFFNIVDIFDEGGCNVTSAFTRYQGHAIDIAKEASLSGNYDCIVCMGGDGTLNETVNGVMTGNRDIPIGYIPAGSTNDFATSMNIDKNFFTTADNILKGNINKLDVGLFNDRYFTYIATFGAFTSISYNTPQSVKNALGHMAYILSGIKDITTIHPYDVSISVDGAEYKDEYIFGAVCNSTSVAGIVKLASDIVDMSDGLFEVILVKKPKNIVELNDIIWKCLSSDFSGKMFEFVKGSEVVFNMPEGVAWSVDGEKVEGKETILIKNINKALNFIG